MDELKEFWKASGKHYDRNKLEHMFQAEVKQSLDALNRRMYLDNILMIVIAVILLITVYFSGLQNKLPVVIEILFITSVVFIHYRIKHRLLNSPLKNISNIKEAVRLTTKRLKSYLLSYKILVPIGFSLIYLQRIWLIMQARQVAWDEMLVEWGLVLPVYIVMYIAVKIIVKFMYGSSLYELNKLNQELNTQQE